MARFLLRLGDLNPLLGFHSPLFSMVFPWGISIRVEDFFAILITNILSSETGRPLRADHDGLDPLPSQLSTNKGFLAVEEYARLVRQFCAEHKSVSQEIRDVPSTFNSIKEVIIGQRYQYLLNDGWEI